jgi:hypothetical protein
VLGATVLPQNIIEQFNVAHASVVEQISSLSVIPSTFNPRADEIRKAKPRLSTVTVSHLRLGVFFLCELDIEII